MNIEEKVIEAMNAKEPFEGKGIGVTNLVYDCLRRAYYTRTLGEFYDLHTLILFWTGRKLHETQILKEHELVLEWEGIVGIVDEYENGTLLEKKTCVSLPRTPNDHHVKQVEYYKVLLEKHGKPVNEAYLLYIDINNKEIRTFKVNMRPSNIIEKEMLERKEKLEKALKEGKPPERKVGWLCNYCNFASICFGGMKKGFTKVNDSEAEARIRQFLSKKKREGYKRTDDIEIMEGLNLPIEQVDRILDKIEKLRRSMIKDERT